MLYNKDKVGSNTVKKINYQDIFYWGIFLVISAVMCVALFGTLGSSDVIFTDEGTHAVNAYEMARKGNWWINTLRYEVDYYNEKPPLMLWLIIFGYKLFGYTPFGLRFFSALSGLIIYILVFSFLYKNRGKVQAIGFAAFLPACTRFFTYHMFRAGDMDAVYTLLFLIAVLALYRSVEKINYLFLYGLALGLAFLCKGSHFVTILGVGVLFSWQIIRRFGWKKTAVCYLGSFITAVAAVLPWAVVRFRFDGLAFFSNLFFKETISRVKGSYEDAGESYFEYIYQMLGDAVCVIAVLLIFLAVVVKIVDEYKKREDIRESRYSPVQFLLTPYINLISTWFIVVIGCYSIAKAGSSWYIYSAYIPLLMLGAEALAYLVREVGRNKGYISKFIFIISIFSSIMISVNMISAYPWKGTGGSPKTGLDHTLRGLAAESEEGVFDQRVMYIENSHNAAFESSRWEHDYMFYAMAALDVLCVDGGVDAFLGTDDMEALLILDKQLWEEYAPVLTGYVILYDSDFLVFSKHKYGE